MKKGFVLLFILTVLMACSSQEQSILKESGEGEKEENKNGTEIIFGEKKGDKKINARNAFKLGEPTHFVVRSEETFNVSSVTIVLKKHNGEEWMRLTEAPLEVKPEWKQLMNGLPGSLYQKTGPGAYKLEVLKGEEVIASGDFIIEKDDQEKQS